MNLIVGATGLVGGEVCRQLAASGSATRALVSRTSSPERIAQLTQDGVETAIADVTDPPSLRAACRGVTRIVSTASSTMSRQPGDSIDTVDRQGQLNLIDAAEAAGVEHFVLISFPPVDIEFPLQSAKRAVEDRLRRSRMTHTILQPTCFTEVWLSPALGFDAANAQVRIYGAGTSRTSWISFRDVASFAVAALTGSRATNQTIRLGGPDAMSPLEIVREVERLLGRPFTVEHVPEEALRAQFDGSSDPLQRSFAALMLYYARGDVIDMSDAQRMLGLPRMTSVAEYLSVGSRIG